MYVQATGDTHIDDHHSNEDIALAIGTVIITFQEHLSVLLLLLDAFVGISINLRLGHPYIFLSNFCTKINTESPFFFQLMTCAEPPVI